MRILILDANGPSGRATVRQALQRGHDVAALTRHPETFPLKHDRLQVVAGDATEASVIDRAVVERDAVISVIGTPYTREPVDLYSSSGRLLLDAMPRHDVRRLLVVTSAAVDARAARQPNPLIRLVLEPLLRHVIGRTLYDDMARLEAVVTRSDLDWTIVRPPALTDAPATGWAVTGEGEAAGTFLAHEDLAAFLLDEIERATAVHQTVVVSSPHADASLLHTLRRGLLPG